MEQGNRELLEDTLGLNITLIQNINEGLKLASYKPKKYFDYRAPKRLPRYFKNNYLSVYNQKYAILAYLFLAEKLRKGYIFDINVDHAVFIDNEDFVIVNARVMYPRYKLKIKKISRISLDNDALSFLYALFDDIEMKLNLKLIKIIFVNPNTKMLLKIVQLIESANVSNFR